VRKAVSYFSISIPISFGINSNIPSFSQSQIAPIQNYTHPNFPLYTTSKTTMHPNILFFGITALTFHTANAVAILPRSTTEIPSFTFSNSTTNSTSDENLPSPKPILVAEICSSVACETVKTVENDCRMLTTVLGPTVGKVVVYNPATCVFSA
jgi:hypothetical protein